MGMQGADIATLLAQLGVAGIGAWAAPEGQELQSFEGEGQLDPRQMLGEGKLRIEDMLTQLSDRNARGVSVRSGYVQQPPVFTGGGLPMPIGVSGMDPALADPKLLRLGGELQPGSFPPRDGTPPVIYPDPNDPDSPPPDTTPGDESGPYFSSRNAASGPARRTLPGQSMFDTPNVSNHDDLGQGMGAMELYLRSLSGL